MKLDCHANWRLLAMTKEYMKQWIPAQHHPQKFSIFAGPEAGMTVLKDKKTSCAGMTVFIPCPMYRCGENLKKK